MNNRITKFLVFFLYVLTFFIKIDSFAQDEIKPAKRYFALIISGVGGDLKHSEKFQRLSNELYNILTTNFGYKQDDIIYLAGDALESDIYVSKSSTRENIASAVAELKRKAKENDQTLVFVVGNGDYNNKVATIHLPGRDLNPSDFSKLFEGYPGNLVFVITTPASGFFLAPLSGKNRTIITATQAAVEINETYFPESFIEALKEIKEKKDYIGSFAEAFQLASQKTEEYFKLRQMIQTEHSMLDDNADGKGSRKIAEDGGDGAFSRNIAIGPAILAKKETVADTNILDVGTKWDELKPSAIVLLNQIEYTVHSDLTYRVRERNLIKIMNKGGHGLSEVRIFYNSAYETLSVESAKTIKANGEIDELKSEAILDVKAVESLMYTESRYKQFSMPSIEDGCVLDYTTVKTGKNLHLSKDFWNTFIIEKGIPQNEIRIIFSIPKTSKIAHKFSKENPVFKISRDESEDKYSKTYTFFIKDIPPLVPEPNSPAIQELATRLIVTSIPSWDVIWKWYKTLSDSARESDDKIKALVEELVKDKNSDVEKAKAIYDWISKSIRYVGLELGKHGYQPHKATSIFENKYGDCKDKATLLLSMLDAAGIKGGSIVLIPTNIMAQVDTTMPTLDQFNHAIATITINGVRYWLDTTGGETAFGDIPVSDQGRTVFVIGADKGEFVTIPVQPPERNMVDSISTIILEADGTIKGNDSIKYTGAFAETFRHIYKYESAFAQKQALENVLNKFIPAAKLETYNITGFDTLADVIIYDRRYIAKEYASIADDLLIIGVPLQKIGLQENVSTASRINPLILGQTMIRKGNMELKIPNGYSVRNFPREVVLKNSFGEYQEKYEIDSNNVLRCNNLFRLEKTQIEPSEYQEFKAFIDEIAKIQRRLVVLIKE